MPRELDAIVAKALAKSLDRRYEAAATIAAELKGHVAAHPVIHITSAHDALGIAELRAAYPDKKKEKQKQNEKAKERPAAEDKAKAMDEKPPPRAVAIELGAQKLIRAVSSERQLREVLDQLAHRSRSTTRGGQTCQQRLEL